MKNVSTLKEYISLIVKEELINEAQIDDAIKNNPGVIGAALETHFKNVKPKYIIWVVRELKRLKQEGVLNDIHLLAKDIEDFDTFTKMNLIQNKDIGSYKDWLAISKIVDEAKLKKKNIDRMKEGKGQSNKLYEDDSFLVIEPLSEAASCVYGKGTQWCISATKSKNWWDLYAGDSKFLFVINKKDPNAINNQYSKLAFRIKANDYPEIFDVADQSLGSISSIQNSLKDILPDNVKLVINDFAIKQKAFPIFFDHLTKDQMMNISNEQFTQYIAGVITNPKVQYVIARYSSFDNARINLAYNENLTPEILNVLSKDPLESVRYLVARNSKTPIESLQKLSDPNIEHIRRVRDAALISLKNNKN